MTKFYMSDVTTILIFSAAMLRGNVLATSCRGFSDNSLGICYELHDDVALSWQNASSACEKSGDGFKLAWITNDVEKSLLRSYLVTNYSLSSSLWLGGRTESLYANSFLWRWCGDKSVLSAQGCYGDQSTVRDLLYEMTPYIVNMTIESCVAMCRSAGFSYAGLQAGTKCFCGNLYGRYGGVNTALESHNCDDPCSGNSSEMCGSIDQNFIYKVTGAFALWGFARPNNWFGYQTCAILSTQVSYKFDDEDCGKPAFAYICDIPTSSCINGSQLLDGMCYFISPSSIKVTWYKARMECRRRGGDLVTVTSHAVWSTLISKIAPNKQSYWIGLSGLYWKWNNDAEVEFYDWLSYSSSQYSPSNIENRCIVIDPQSSYLWIDENCDQLHHYVCMRDETKAIMTSVTSMISPTTEPTNASHLDSTTISLIVVCGVFALTLCAVGVTLFFYRKQNRLSKIHANYLPEEGATSDNQHSAENYSSTENLHKNLADDLCQLQDPVIGSPPRPNTFDYWNQQLRQ